MRPGGSAPYSRTLENQEEANTYLHQRRQAKIGAPVIFEVIERFAGGFFDGVNRQYGLLPRLKSLIRRDSVARFRIPTFLEF